MLLVSVPLKITSKLENFRNCMFYDLTYLAEIISNCDLINSRLESFRGVDSHIKAIASIYLGKASNTDTSTIW